MKKKTSSNNLVTKNDLKRELSVLERRMDKKFSTKKDLKTTEKTLRDDIDRLENRMKLNVDEIVSNIREDNRKHLDEFRTQIDPILKEVLASREERAALSHQIGEVRDQVENHEERIETLETVKIAA